MTSNRTARSERVAESNRTARSERVAEGQNVNSSLVTSNRTARSERVAEGQNVNSSAPPASVKSSPKAPEQLGKLSAGLHCGFG